ncbi:unnamed protein product [Amoebophrya sp. A25]|nr:unnamed protein product [Amoebophrya sp. A25]|eukprot:GSA25T00024282001.1
MREMVTYFDFPKIVAVTPTQYGNVQDIHFDSSHDIRNPLPIERLQVILRNAKIGLYSAEDIPHARTIVLRVLLKSGFWIKVSLHALRHSQIRNQPISTSLTDDYFFFAAVTRCHERSAFDAISFVHALSCPHLATFARELTSHIRVDRRFNEYNHPRAVVHVKNLNSNFLRIMESPGPQQQ